MPYKTNTTLIDDLPTLDELDISRPTRGLDMIPENSPYNKVIRNSGYTTPAAAGMDLYTSPSYYTPIQPFTPPQDFNPMYKPYQNEPQIKENFTKVSLVSCVDAADHVKSCVVCSKLYKNNNTLLILLLVFLAVINLLLLKRILETEK
jgi:hypothetical protein